MRVEAAGVPSLGSEAAPPRGIRLGREAVRRLAWLALAGQVAFVAAWIVAGALEPHYSHVKQAISELGARNAAHPWIMNAGFVVLGLSIAALGAAVLQVLPRRRASRVAAALFALAGVAVVLIAAFPLDCGLTVDKQCIAQWHAGDLSWRTNAHLWASLLFPLAFVGTPFAIARALWPAPAGTLALTSGLTGIALYAATFAGEDDTGVDGLAQRLGFVPIHVWVAIVAIGVLYATPAERRGALIPIRPREFYGGRWSGQGELVLWPPFVWRRLGQRFQFHREVEWLTDRAWTVEDRATFGNGMVMRRRMFAETVGEDLVHVTADDMPNGVDLRLEEDGYRVAPYRLAVPIGPARITLRLRDEVRIAGPDGRLDWTIHMRWLGYPVAQIHGQVGPVREETLLRRP